MEGGFQRPSLSGQSPTWGKAPPEQNSAGGWTRRLARLAPEGPGKHFEQRAAKCELRPVRACTCVAGCLLALSCLCMALVASNLCPASCKGWPLQCLAEHLCSGCSTCALWPCLALVALAGAQPQSPLPSASLGRPASLARLAGPEGQVPGPPRLWRLPAQEPVQGFAGSFLRAWDRVLAEPTAIFAPFPGYAQANSFYKFSGYHGGAGGGLVLGSKRGSTLGGVATLGLRPQQRCTASSGVWSCVGACCLPRLSGRLLLRLGRWPPTALPCIASRSTSTSLCRPSRYTGCRWKPPGGVCGLSSQAEAAGLPGPR